MLEYNKEYPNIGNVLFKRSGRAKNIGISVGNSKGVVVTVPNSSNYSDAEKFVQEKLAWIRQTLDKLALNKVMPDIKNQGRDNNESLKSEISREYPEIGKVQFKKSGRAKNIGISVKILKGIVVTVPNRICFDDAESFVIRKKQWIKRALQKVSQIEKKQTVFSHDNTFCTKFRQLKLIAEKRINVKVNVVPDFVEIYYPDSFEITNNSLQETIRKAVEHAWRVEAHEYLPKRLDTLSKLHNLSFSGLKIKNTRSFWGRCYSNKEITLSLHLMHLPDELIDYVILHELCHTIHLDHGKQFWQLMGKVTGNQAMELDNKMKDHSTIIF